MLEWRQFKKPQRYIGNEWNVVKKDHHRKIKICLCYPDLYEVGMSNVGIRIIYAKLNSFNDVVCERVFMPDDDFYAHLAVKKKKLFSLETKTYLCDFDVLGFNFNYELNFTNFLAMLKISGIEPRALDRKNLIILGGGVANPEGLAEFVDVFFLGEFEDKASHFLDILRKHKAKDERLRALAELDGFYIPRFYNIYLKGDRFIFEKKYKYAKLPIKKVIVRDLDNSFFPLKWLVPHTEIIHNRAQIEISRGCPNNCFFCQARCTYFPYRERKRSCVLDLAEKIYKTSGYENFSLLALSASDHSEIENIINDVTEFFEKKRVGVSLPSLRIEDVLDKLYRPLRKLKKVSATFAVEAATQKLRESINKKIDIDRLRETARLLRSLHCRHIKLYFMFGLPSEDYEDLLAIGEFVKELRGDSGLKINLSINAFIPKPFSYFENIKMVDGNDLLRKRKIILSNIPRDKNIKVSMSDAERSILEAVISCADRSFSKVLYHAHLLGARFDAYRERFKSDAWAEAFSKFGININEYLSRSKEILPWSFVETGYRRNKIEE